MFVRRIYFDKEIIDKVTKSDKTRFQQQQQQQKEQKFTSTISKMQILQEDFKKTQLGFNLFALSYYCHWKMHTILAFYLTLILFFLLVFHNRISKLISLIIMDIIFTFIDLYSNITIK